MTVNQMIYLISRAADIHEYKSGRRPELVILPESDFWEVAGSPWHVVSLEDEKAEFGKMCGMTLKLSMRLPSGKFILGEEYDLGEGVLGLERMWKNDY